MSTIVPEHRMSHLWSSDGRRVVVLALAIGLTSSTGCRRGPSSSAAAPATRARASILLVTLDTTRADAIGPEAPGVQTPAFNALAARGRRFRQAYATVPETLPSHSSMMTGLYPGRARHPRERPLSCRRPSRSSPSGCSRPGIARRRSSRRSRSRGGSASRAGSTSTTTSCRPAVPSGARARPTDLRRSPSSTQRSERPRFMWVHFYDPHEPYAPPEPYRTRYAEHPYLGEVASDGRADRTAGPGLRAAGEAARPRSSSLRITAKGSAITARRSTAICSISRRCTCRWWWWRLA